MENRLRIGVITSTHGIKGEVKVYPTTDDLNRFKILKKCYIRTKVGNRVEDIQVEKSSCKFFKNMAILQFKGYEDINKIECYKQCEIYVDRADAVKLKEDEYFIADIIDADVYLESGEKYGVLKEVMATGANDVYSIERLDGKEILVPVIKQCVLEIDTENKKVVIRLMKGME